MNINTAFPKKWLSAADLQGRTVTVFIERVTAEAVFNTRTKKSETKLAVAFHGKAKRLILNRTQAYAMAAACGSPETDNWAGHTVLLSVGMAPNGQETIVVTAKPEAHAEDAPGPATVTVAADDDVAALWGEGVKGEVA